MRTIIYIDGFNFYYRAVKRTPFKWLDLKLLSEKMLKPFNKITAIKYYSAPVSGTRDPGQPTRQMIYFAALQAHIPEFSYHFGHFLSHVVSMPLANPSPAHKYERVIKTEEKGSDVNLAVHLLNDAWHDRFDCAVVISNDSDLAEALRLVREEQRKVIGVLTPGEKTKPSAELIKHANFVKKIRNGVLRDSQLPSPIPGTAIYKPCAW